MINKILFIILVIGLGSLSAQTFKSSLVSSSSVNEVSIDKDTLKILAIMVNFQEDKDGTTFGNGKFGSIYSTDYGNSIIDPLPHDREYFEDHLTFVKNYFNKVSQSNLHIEFTVLPDTFSVSKTMRNYSPEPGSDDLTNIADFSVETWTLADQIYPGFDFSSYDLFTVFHAGVGRDISLPGSIGNERDLPSIYLSEKSFKDIYGESFDGIPVSGGSFKITNSMIMPETESRELSTIVGTALFQITINGLLAASIGSHLGLPDLFDTETGLSAIGRFGLMDGQGIFAYNGTYPPEPSPWSKIYLGWAEPVTINLGNPDINIVAKLAANLGDTVIIKVPLNSSEYFLIENRARDANGDGSIVTFKVDGTTITRTFTKDTTGYLSFDVDSLSGVILDVDEFDWAVPGSGILIWHIDENVIAQNLSTNTINNDKDKRGVDVEEADGVQDIGEIFKTILGDEVIGEGTKFDLWYSSNSSELYQNRFAKDTRPNTSTNTGANSLITIKDFSDISNRMSFKVEYGDSIIKPVFSQHLPLPGIFATDLTVLDNNQQSRFCLHTADMITIANVSGSVLEEYLRFSNTKPAAVYYNQTQFIVGVLDSTLNIYLNDGIASSIHSLNTGVFLTATPVIRNLSNGGKDLLVGTSDGRILNFDLPADGQVSLIDDIATSTDKAIKQIAVDGNYWAAITASGTEKIDLIDSDGNKLSLDDKQFSLLLTKNGNGEYVQVLFSTEKILFVKKGKITTERTVTINQTFPIVPALGDIKQDGINYLIYPAEDQIEAVNFSGYLADNFPFDALQESLAGLTLTGDFAGDSNVELLTTSVNGDIIALDGGSGKIVSEFPLSAGGTFISSMVLYIDSGKVSVAAIDDNKFFRAWHIGLTTGNLQWKEKFADSQNTSFIDAAESSNFVNEFLPQSRAYNYPNPVYEGTTNIRYYVSEDANINIKIFDLAGDFVAELNDVAQGRMDNETVWDVSGIQSGVYFARIEAVGNSGKSEFAIIKIAVVK